MGAVTMLEEALTLALKLAPKERLDLIERVASSIGREIEENAVPNLKSKTGSDIVAMLRGMDPIEMVDSEIEDPVEWVKAQRRKEADRLNPYRDGEK